MAEPWESWQCHESCVWSGQWTQRRLQINLPMDGELKTFSSQKYHELFVFWCIVFIEYILFSSYICAASLCKTGTVTECEDKYIFNLVKVVWRKKFVATWRSGLEKLPEVVFPKFYSLDSCIRFYNLTQTMYC